jgi:NADH-quinone oxidoreductase subunit A
MYRDFGAVLVFILIGAAFVFGGLIVGWFVRLQRRNAEKITVYECGEPTIGTSWIRYNSRFYNVALVYLLFDVEVVVLIPPLLVLREMALAGSAIVPLVGLMGFIFLLALGLAYEWHYGNLDWIRRISRDAEQSFEEGRAR